MERMFYITLLRAFIFLSTIFIIQFYFAKRLRNSLIELKYFGNKKRLNFAIITPILFFDIFPVFTTFVSVYNVINPKTDFEIPKTFFIDYIFRLPSWFAIIIVVQVVLLFVPIDVIFYVLKKIKISLYNRLKVILSKFFIYTCIFFLAYVPLRSYYEYKKIEVTKKIYNLNSSRKDLQNFKIAFISDIQLDRFTNVERVNKYIKTVNELNPDIILAGGDFISSDSNYIPIVANLAGNLKSKYGVYSCIGDHDFAAYKKQYWRSLTAVKEALKNNDVMMIDNGNLNLFVNESVVKITFLSSTYIKPYNETIFDSLAQSNLDADLKILVTHQPDEQIALKAKDYGYNLYLCGHTHGGQINFLFPFLNITPVRFETKFISGEFWFDNLLMIVNRGLGMSTIPIRYHSVPEVTLIEIKIK